MAVVTTYSTALTNAKATPRVQNPAGIERGRIHRSQALVAITSGDNTGSVYGVCRIRSSDWMDKIRLDCPDIGTTTAVDIGLYDIASDGTVGTVVDADFFASAVALNAGAISNTDVTFESAAAGGSLANAEKRIWEIVGSTTDPHKEYYVCLTLTAAADASGTALVRLYVCNGD